jgi:hypothetical protein
VQFGGDPQVFHADSPADAQQLLRHIEEHPAVLPLWRRERPALMVHDAQYVTDEVSFSVRGHTACNT